MAQVTVHGGPHGGQSIELDDAPAKKFKGKVTHSGGVEQSVDGSFLHLDGEDGKIYLYRVEGDQATYIGEKA